MVDGCSMGKSNLGALVDGFAEADQLALYQTCVEEARACIDKIAEDVADAQPGAPLGPGSHEIPFQVRQSLLLCFSCLDSSIHQIVKTQGQERALVNAGIDFSERKFMSKWKKEDFTELGAVLHARRAAVANHHAFNKNGQCVFKTNQLWNTLKHCGMLPMSIVQSRSTQNNLLVFNGPAPMGEVDVVAHLRDFCMKVEAWVGALTTSLKGCLMSEIDLDALVGGFTVAGQLALYQTCVKEARACIDKIEVAVARAQPGKSLGPGRHEIPFQVRQSLLLCFSCLDSSIHQVVKTQGQERALVEAGLDFSERKFMSHWKKTDFTELGAALRAPRAAVANHVFKKNDQCVFKTNQLWNTLKHRGMMPMSITQSGANHEKVLVFNGPAPMGEVDVVAHLRDFCMKVEAWVGALKTSLN